MLIASFNLGLLVSSLFFFVCGLNYRLVAGPILLFFSLEPFTVCSMILLLMKGRLNCDVVELISDQSFLELSKFCTPFLFLGDLDCRENTYPCYLGLICLKSTLMSCGIIPASLRIGCISLINSSCSSTMDPLIVFLII